MRGIPDGLSTPLPPKPKKVAVKSLTKRKWICRASEFPEADGLQDPYLLSREWLDELVLEDIFYDLTVLRCEPGVCRRGRKWRFHINTGTNIWEDGSEIKTAINKTLKLWAASRRPTKDGKGVELWIQEQKRGTNVTKVKVWRVI